MNKLEEYRDNYCEKSIPDDGEESYFINLSEVQKSGFKDGFNVAIELDLPVKFAEWKDENFYQQSNGKYYPHISSSYYNIIKLIQFQPQNKIDLKELYQYWKTYVYKAE